METQYISLNMTPTGVNPCFHISQYDVGRMLGFIVHSGGATVDLDTYTCTIEATRSDGTAITSAVATTDNIGTFEVTPTMSNKADKYRCQLVIVDANSKRIASLPFDMEVTKAAMDENSEAIEEDASLYQQYTEAVQGAIAEANADIQAEENARIAAVNSEASTRASADSNLQSQINQIVAPSGEAPSAVEVQNARIGADGVTYDTLGTAIRSQVNNLKEDIIDLDELFNWSADKTNILNGMTPVDVGRYVDYSTGDIGTNDSYKWYEISVTEGQTFKYNGNDAHVAFFSVKYDGTTVDYYLSGLLIQKNRAFTVPKNAVSMTISVPIDYPNWLGKKGDDEYRQNTTIKKECLPKDEQIIAIRSQVNNLKEDITDLDELFNWDADKTNILNGITPVDREYVDYSTGDIGTNDSYKWYEISVTEGQTFKYNGNNAHVAFFSKKYDGTTVDYYLSGLLPQENIAFTVPKNAVSMTISVPIDYSNWLGNGDDEYRQNTTIKKECLPKIIVKDKQIIVGGTDGTYTNIVKAVKECEENTTIIVRSGTYDLEAQFKEVYGDDFFVNYKGYSADSNFELSGLYLKRGVKLIADSGTVLSFMYSGNNSKVSEEFSPINMTLDNIVDGFIIEVNSNVRYHIHDDFAYMAFMNVNNYGRNEIKNCIFKGNSTMGSAIGGGMGTYCKYIVHDNYFENTTGNAVSYHNSVFQDAQNFIDIFNNYAKTPIALHWYGASTKITTALVHNNTASLIECTKLYADTPNENIKMKAWNNNIV